MSKCDTCRTFHDVNSSAEPACCKWFMDNVVILGKPVDDCTEYVPMQEKPDDTEAFNDFGDDDSEDDDCEWDCLNCSRAICPYMPF